MLDGLHRPLRTLRISVTDRCNFRCAYCMPTDPVFLQHAQILTFEEIERLVRLLANLGVRKLRLTGGEPLVRRDLPDLVGRLAGIPGIREIALTTNGSLLGGLAEPLAQAGLQRVTVSLDSLDPEGFARMSGVGAPLAPVLEGIQAARRAGLVPLKLNCVVRRGWNDDQIVPVAAFAREHGLEARFIEFMDVGTENRWEHGEVLPSAEIRARIAQNWPLIPAQGERGSAPSSMFTYVDGKGRVGFISSVSEPFCRGCDRARLSSDGRLFTCLFAGEGTDLKAPMRAGEDDARLLDRLRSAWGLRHDRYSEIRGEGTPTLAREEMFRLGG